MTSTAFGAQDVVLRLDHITKRFGALTANDAISMVLHRGEVIALLRPSFLIGIGAFAEERLRRSAAACGSEAHIGRILHPSPASPAANRGWSQAASRQLAELGVW